MKRKVSYDEKAQRLRALQEAWRSVSEAREPTIAHPIDVLPYVSRSVSAKQEHFHVVLLDSRHSVIAARVVTKGLLNRVMVHPREVFRLAVKKSASAIIVAHNHPSGNVDPSSEDRDVAKKLTAAGEILGIPVIDFVVFAKSGFVSFLEQGWL